MDPIVAVLLARPGIVAPRTRVPAYPHEATMEDIHAAVRSITLATVA
jgi:hypothetical protein